MRIERLTAVVLMTMLCAACTDAIVVAGSAVMFLTPMRPDRPALRLAYRLRDADMLAIVFEIAAPGRTTFAPTASGTLRRAPRRTRWPGPALDHRT